MEMMFYLRLRDEHEMAVVEDFIRTHCHHRTGTSDRSGLYYTVSSSGPMGQRSGRLISVSAYPSEGYPFYNDECDEELQDLIDCVAAWRGEPVCVAVKYVNEEDIDGDVYVYTSGQPKWHIALGDIADMAEKAFKDTGDSRLKLVKDTTYMSPGEPV